MQNPLLLRIIYAELRANAGAELAAGDLLRLAHIILRAFRADFIEPADEPQKRGRTDGFHALPVDEAMMMNGGWKVFDFEAPNSPRLDDAGPDDHLFLIHRLNKYLGHEWQRLTPLG